MKEIKLHDTTFKIYIPETEIAEIVQKIAEEINNTGIENPLFIAVLNGSFLFAADVIRKITIDNQKHFFRFMFFHFTLNNGKVGICLTLGTRTSKNSLNKVFL